MTAMIQIVDFFINVLFRLQRYDIYVYEAFKKLIISVKFNDFNQN